MKLKAKSVNKANNESLQGKPILTLSARTAVIAVSIKKYEKIAMDVVREAKITKKRCGEQTMRTAATARNRVDISMSRAPNDILPPIR